jgi:hypothetical protein
VTKGKDNRGSNLIRNHLENTDGNRVRESKKPYNLIIKNIRTIRMGKEQRVEGISNRRDTDGNMSYR